jgi:hypothetical protein
VDEREFWIQVRRWLKIQNAATSQMIEAIEQRFGPFGDERRQERQALQPGRPAA